MAGDSFAAVREQPEESLLRRIGMQVDPIRVFWVPGCSACAKVKEFLTDLGVPYESVNCLDNPQGMADLKQLGARSLPVVSRGRSFVFAQSLRQVAEFVGTAAPDRNPLPPEELIARWQEILSVAHAQTGQIPPERLLDRPVPGRERTVLELAFHIFQVPDAFLRNVAGEFEDWGHYVNLPPPKDMRTTRDIRRFGQEMMAAVAEWWDRLEERECLWTVRTHYGVRPAWELLERQTWHSAQHLRQLHTVLEGLGVPLKRRPEPRLFEDLPMPEAIW